MGGVLSSSMNDSIEDDSSKKMSHHRKASSEDLIDLSEAPLPQDVTNETMPQDTAGSERQKQPKRPRKRRDTVGSSQEDELSKGHNNPNPQLPSGDNVIKELQQKLADQTLENETFKKVNSAWRSRCSDQQHLIRDLEHQLNNLQAEQKDLQNDYWAVEDKTERLKRKNEQLSQGLKSEYDLAKKLDKANETCEKLRAHWVEATEELEQLQKTGKKFHVDDDSVVSVWNSLAYKIRNLSSKASMRKGTSFAPTSEQLQAFGCTFHDFEKYFPSHAKILFEQCIWSELGPILFAPSKIWSYEFGGTVASITRSILRKNSTPALLIVLTTNIMQTGHPSSTEAEVNRCHEWRAETNHLLHDNCEKLDKMDEEKQGRLIQGLCLLIKQWSADFGHEELITDLRGILHNLVEFCSITARANAAYVPFTLQRNISHNMQFKDDCMEFRAMTSPERGVVDLIVSPGLAKYGNSDGENYHQREILDKLGVAF